MSQKHPELIFVAGPQSGQRVVLSRPAAVLGRGGGADILLSEEYVSRSQARYELLGAGPVIENLSARGTWINGKRYKAGKQVLLATGDLIGTGQATQILFVAAGDDPAAALAMYRASIGTGKDAFGQKSRAETEKQKPPPQPIPEPVAPPSPAGAGVQDRPAPEEKRSSEMSVGERLEAEQRARRRKITISLGIYLGVIVLVGIILTFTIGKTDRSQPMPDMMTKSQISDALHAPIQRMPNPLRKEKKLNQAIGLYQQHRQDTQNLYPCVQAFKEALAYSDRGYFDDPEHDKIYHDVMDRFVKEVQKRYRYACIQEKDKEWQLAEKEFERLLAMVRDEKNPGRNPLFRNIQDHYKRVKHLRQKKKPKKRRPWM